jgi:hypothetical protein
MATWKAEIKVGTYGTPFEVEVVAGSSGTAKETINTIYSPVYIRNLRVVSNRNKSFGSSSTSETSSGMYWFVGFVLILYVIVTYWYIVVPASIVIGLLWLWAKN